MRRIKHVLGVIVQHAKAMLGSLAKVMRTVFSKAGKAVKTFYLSKTRPVLRRVKILTLLQLSNKMKLKLDNPSRFAAAIALRIFVIALISVGFTFIVYIVRNFLYIPTDAYFMIFILVLTQGISIVTATSALINDLYKSKENQILLAFPVQLNEVFTSKILVYYLNELIKNLYFVIPLLIGFGFVNRMSLLYYLNIVPMIFVLPLIAVLVAALISIPFVYAKNIIARSNIASLVMVIGFLALVYYGITVILAQVTIPIRIIALYNRFIFTLSTFMRETAQYASIYRRIGYLLFNVNTALNYLIVFGIMTALLALMVFISRPLYFKLASQSMEFAVQKKHIKQNKRERSLFLTFLRKELIIAKRNVNQLINDYAILLSLPFFLYVLNYLYMGMNRNTTGNQLVLVFNVLIVLLLTTASNTAAATAITTEGWEFILLKTAPSETSKMAWAKITFNLAFSAIMVLISFLIFRFTMPILPLRPLDIWLLYGLVVVINSAHILWSFQLDLLNPRLSDYASTGSLSGNPNMSKSMGIGFGIALLFGVIAVVLFLFMPGIAWVVLFSLAIPFLVMRFYFFDANLKTYFIDIEF